MMKVLFVITDFTIGGTRSSLVNLLTEITSVPDSETEVVLFALSHTGTYRSDLPEGIRVVPEKKYISRCLPKGKKSLFGKLYHGAFHLYKGAVGYKRSLTPLFRKAAREIKAEYGEFDAVFGYQEGIPNFFSSFIHAKKHFVWVHSDVDKWYDRSVFVKEVYDRANRIIFVADASRAKFCEMFPEYTEKSMIIKNTLSKKMLVNKSNLAQIPPFDDRVVNIISVGRMVEAKAFDRVVAAGDDLLKHGIPYQWRIIGDGPLFDSLENQIKEKVLQDNILLLGAMSNPYPYIKQSDLLVMTSINENQPMVILEALTLGVPVLTTKFDSALEIINDAGYGMICENNEEDLSKALAAILSSREKRIQMREKAALFSVDNSAVVNGVLGLISGNTV